MSIKNIEKILSNLIKNGDRETISDIISLLEEVKDFKQESKPNSVKESFQKHTQQIPQKQIQKPKINGDVNDIIARASMVTEALYENGGPKARATIPTFGSFQSQSNSVNGDELITTNNPYPVHTDITSYADMLL